MIEPDANIRLTSYYTKTETQRERSEHPMAAVRTHHNTIKRMLYFQVLNYTPYVKYMLDLGAGRGGDLSKYNAIKVGHVVAVDVSEPDLEELINRHSKMRMFPNYTTTLDVRKGDMRKPHLGMEEYFWYTPGYFNMIACHFALHYAFESAATFDACLNNIKTHLAPGGMFIATILDGQAVSKKLRESQTAKLSNQAEFHSLHEGRIDFGYASITGNGFLQKDLGNAIEVQIASISDIPITEYLVDYSFLKETMEAHYGLEILVSEMFPPGSLQGVDAEYSTMHRYIIARRKA